MSISIKFLDGLYRRKHEHISALGYYEREAKKCSARVQSAKTERVKKLAEKDLASWTKCVDGAKDRLLHIEVLIPEYINAHGIKGDA